MSNLKANKITDSNGESTCQNGFSDLRRLTRIVDNGMKEVKTRIEEIECDGVGSNFDHRQQYLNETAALLFLQRSQKDVKSISSDIKSIHDDFKMRSSTLNSVICLFEYALESFKSRLEKVESFTEQYGYKRPLLSLPELEPPPSLDKTVEAAERSNGNKQVDCIDGIDRTQLQNMTDPVENELNIERNKNFSDSDPGTPKLEYMYLSENTLSILNSECFDNFGSCTPAEKKTALISPQPSNEMSTPKLESYGISEHTLKYLLSEDAQVDEPVPVEDTHKTYESSPQTPILRGLSFDYNFASNLATTMKKEKEEQKEVCFDLPPTPKLDGLSEHTLKFLSRANAVGIDKGNICLDSTPVAASPTVHYHQSPDLDPVVCQSHDSPYLNMPATPKLNSLGLSQHTLRFLNLNDESLF